MASPSRRKDATRRAHRGERLMRTGSISNTATSKFEAAAGKPLNSRKRSSLLVTRRQAARILRTILQGDANRRAIASVKSLIYQPSVRNKKATMALVCQTLKYLPVIKEVLENTDSFKPKDKVYKELLYVLIFELLFGKELVSCGRLEEHVLSHKSSLRATLARMLVKRGVTCAEDMLSNESSPGSKAVHYVRVNTLKMEVSEALEILRRSSEVKEDSMIPGLLAMAAGTDLHRHPLVAKGVLILQGKASCMPALALAPDAEWEVLDACAAPGNKTVHLAALMKGRGRIFACELSKNRLKRLQETVELAGACNVEVLHQDFLKLDPNSLAMSKVKAILLDPSCSGSGTAYRRLDHLLPSFKNSQNYDEVDSQRLERLANFQGKALQFALSFPAVERVVYSTCSIHQQENEDVIQFALDRASRNGFHLATPFPNWQQRGLPVFEGAHHLLRVEPSEDVDGFFVALFVRRFQNSEGDSRWNTPLEPPSRVKKECETFQCFGKKKRLSIKEQIFEHRKKKICK